MKKKVLYLLILLILGVTGCALLEPEEKTFKDNGMSITLTDEFTEKDLVSTTVYFESMDAIVTGLKEEFSTLEAAGLTKDSTVEDYAKAVTTNNQKDSEIKTEDGLTYFTYTSDVNGKTYFYIATVYKSNDAFWLFNFACDSSDQEKFESTFKTWAKSVSFE